MATISDISLLFQAYGKTAKQKTAAIFNSSWNFKQQIGNG